MWKAKFESFERRLTALDVDINLTNEQKPAGIGKEEWKEIENSDRDPREWQTELLKTYEEAMVDKAEVAGKRRRKVKKEVRLKEGIREWNMVLMKPYDEDSKEESSRKTMLQEAKLPE